MGMDSEPNYENILRQAAEQLQSRFPHQPEEQVCAIAREELSKLRSAKVKDYLYILTVRAAMKRMSASGVGAKMRGTP